MCDNLVQEQIQLENENIQEAIAKYRRKAKDPKQRTLPDYFLMNKAFIPLRKRTELFIKEKRKGGFYAAIKDVLKELSSEETSFITLKTLFNTKLGESSLQTICQQIGKALLLQINYKRFEKENPGYSQKVFETQKSSTEAHKTRAWRAILKKKSKNKLVLSSEEIFQLGRCVVSFLIEATGIVELTDLKIKNTKKYQKTLCWEKQTEKFFRKAHKKCEGLFPSKTPMVCPPKPWINTQEGGYYVLDIPLFSFKEGQEKQNNTLVPPDVLKSINFIQSIPWKVNTDVLKIAQNFYYERQFKEGVLTDPETEVIFPISPVPPEYKDAGFETWKKDPKNEEDFKKWKQATTRCHDKLNALRSKVRAEGDTLRIAEKYSKYKKIFFPHYFDFRGRVYPSPVFLNPQGEDLAKGLLLFSKKKQLGKEGLFWLAVHGANVFGEDHCHLQERVDWINKNRNDIFLSAKNPFENSFWTKADKPWQFLAFCIEWRNAFLKGDPTKYKCSLPVAIDGSCNGLQHLAALLRDEVGGAKVNLKNLPERQDVYLLVMEKVQVKLSTGKIVSDLGKKDYSSYWLPVLNRKLIKRNVMTVPYGVTMRGMADQLIEEIKLKEAESYRPLQDTLAASCSFLGRQNYSTIAEELPSAIIVKEWLQKCADVFYEAGLPIKWKTPLGLEIVQTKQKIKTKRIATTFGRQKLKLSFKKSSGSLDRMKQKEGISPNVVHSLDATHLMKTVLKAIKGKISSVTFVHDSYGCLPSEMGRLFKYTRETFVELYTKDILADLRKQFEKQLPPNLQDKLPVLPTYGSLDISEVEKSEFFFA